MQPYFLRIKTWARKNWPLFLILIFALFLRNALRAELLLDKNVYSFQMAEDAWRVAVTIRDGIFEKEFLQNLADVRSSQGLLRILLNIPLVMLYVTFGFSRFISISYSLIASAINILLIYSIAKRLFDSHAGLIASLIWTLVPFDVLLGGVVSSATPLLTVSLLSIFLLIKASMQFSWRRLLVVFIPIIFIGLYSKAVGISLFVMATAITILLVTQTNHIRFRLTNRYWVFIITIVAFLLLTFAFSITNPNIVFSAFVNITNTAGVFLHLVFFLVSLAVLGKNHRRNSALLTIWFLIALFGLLFSISGTGRGNSLLVGETFLFAFLPIVIAEGAYFSKLLNTKSMTWFVGVIFGISLAALLVIYGDHELIPDYGTFALGNANLILIYAEIAAGLAVITAVCSPIVFSIKPQWKVKIAALLLFGFLFAMLPAVWEVISPYREALLSAEQGYEFLQKQPIKLPVYFMLNIQRDLYSFIQGLDSQQKENRLSLRKDVTSLNEIGDGYVIVPEESVNVVPDSLVELIATGLVQDRDLIFRSSTESKAISELEYASVLAQEAPTQENQDRLFAAEINSGQLCNAYTTWIMQRLEGNSLASYIQISDGLDCFKEGNEGSTSLTEALAPRIQSLARIDKVYDPDLATIVWSIYQVEFIYQDPRALSFEVELKPNSFYIYTGWFRAKEEATILYWKLGDWEEFITRGRVPSWTRFGALIYTGNKPDAKTKISLYPALIGNYGFVYLYDIKLIEISSTQN